MEVEQRTIYIGSLRVKLICHAKRCCARSNLALNEPEEIALCSNLNTRYPQVCMISGKKLLHAKQPMRIILDETSFSNVVSFPLLLVKYDSVSLVIACLMIASLPACW